MSTVTVPLEDDLLKSLREQSSIRGTTVEALLASQAKRLNDVFLAHPHPVEVITGTADPDVDLKAEYRAYLEKKYM